MTPIAGGTIITLMAAAAAASSSQEFETFLKLELPAASRFYFTSRKDVGQSTRFREGILWWRNAGIIFAGGGGSSQGGP